MENNNIVSSTEPDANEPIEYLVSRRSRRSTAGNRMEVALAEMASEQLGLVEEEDREFVLTKDEEDVFESDFESTDEEEANEDSQQTTEVSELRVREEERAARKSSRKTVEKQTALAYRRQKATFNPATTADSSKTTFKRVRLLHPQSPVQSELSSQNVRATRQSKRKSAILNRGQTARRLKDQAEKRASVARKKATNKPTEVKALTQAELIQRALDNEEGNVASHRMYLDNEEEKRRKATTLKRECVRGPLVRWVSKIEEVEVPVESPRTGSAYPTNYDRGSTQVQQPIAPPETSQPSLSSSFVLQLGPPPPQAVEFSSSGHDSHSQEIERQKVNVTKNYLIHELSQPSSSDERISKPSWSQTMSAIFGTHVEWDKVRVWGNSRNRPLSRPVRRCPLTGQIALYLDPRTNVPYRDSTAFKILTDILEHRFIWSPEGEMYIGREAEASSNMSQSARQTEDDAMDVDITAGVATASRSGLT